MERVLDMGTVPPEARGVPLRMWPINRREKNETIETYPLEKNDKWFTHVPADDMALNAQPVPNGSQCKTESRLGGKSARRAGDP